MSDQDVLLATASGENVKFWSTPNIELQSVRLFGGMVNCTCWSLNNTLLATAVEENVINVASFKGDSTIDIATGEEQVCLCFSSNSRYLLSGSRNGVAQIWDLKHKTSRKSFVKDQRSSILCTTFNYNDTTIASGCADGDVLLHNVVSGSASGPLRRPKTQAVRGIQFSNFQKNLLATASDDSAINLWDVSTKQLVAEFKDEHKLPSNGVCFSPANDMLMCSIGIDKKIVFYDVVGKKTIKSINTDAPLTSVDFFHNGSSLIVGTATGKLQLYDLRSGSVPIKSAVADKVAIKTVSFQKALIRTSSKDLTRKGSNSSISSTSSTKSRESTNDIKEPKTVPSEEKKKTWVDGIASESETAKQPVSLFSPLRGDLTPAVDARNEDSDIVPMEIMRKELLKKSSLLSSLHAEGQKVSDTPKPTRSELSDQSLPRNALEKEGKTETRPEKTKTRIMLSKTPSDSQLLHRTESSPERRSVESSKSLVNGQNETSPSLGATSSDEKPPNGLHEFQIEFIRNMIEDAIEDTRESIHRGFVHIQGEMLRQFHMQQDEIRRLVEQLSPNQQLIEENARLKEEIRRLKTNF
ncbi:protein NEDD1-like [Rhopilema esculentum]|uniref:protein NEDD1-like n=1 Tax=Rhopilema esculentum TaxID=499914 RepID=UPI0031E1DA29